MTLKLRQVAGLKYAIVQWEFGLVSESILHVQESYTVVKRLPNDSSLRRLWKKYLTIIPSAWLQSVWNSLARK